jgi:hypothetical protein
MGRRLITLLTLDPRCVVRGEILLLVVLFICLGCETTLVFLQLHPII